MSYKKFSVMMIISFIIMYCVMFLNITQLDYFYVSTTRIYMALLMISPMAVVMMLMMGKMYPNKTEYRYYCFGHYCIHYYISRITDTNTYWRCTIHESHDTAPLISDTDKRKCQYKRP